MSKQSVLFSILAIAVGLAATSAEPAAADDWPNKPIRVIVPLGAGSATDIVPRTVFEQVSRQLGQPMIIENRVGAGGTLGAGVVAKADADGYTILAHSSAQTISPWIYPNLPYDTVRDFAGITPLGSLPNVLVISPDKNIRAVQALVAVAKAKPGAMNYASGGTGTPTHLNAERFRLAAGIDAQHIPFKGAPEALTEVMTGRVDYYFCPILPALQFIRDGKLLALAVGSRNRVSLLPDIPTPIEAGFDNSDYNFWIGVYVPAKTPRAIVGRLHGEIITALKEPAVGEKLSKLGIEPMMMQPEEMDAYVVKELQINAALVGAAGIGGK